MIKVLFILVVVCLGQDGFANTGLVRGRSSKIGDATHLEFQGRTIWDYQLTRIDQKTVELAVPAFDEPTEILLKSYQDDLIESVNVDKSNRDENFRVKIVFKTERVETFDYLTDEPSRLVIDFYQVEQNEPNLKPKKAAKPKPSLPSAYSEQRVEGDYKSLKSANGRVLAGEMKVDIEDEDSVKETKGFPLKGVFDGGDPLFSRFRMKEYEIKEEAMIASQQNIYIRFPFLKMPISQLQPLLNESTEYSINPDKNKENKEARFVLHLAKKGRDAAFQKSYNYFVNQYPKSKYDEIIRNVAGEFFFKAYLKEPSGKNFKRVEDTYSYLQNKYPNSIVAERNLLLMAYAYLERGDALNTLQFFKKILSSYPETEHWDQAQKAMSEAYLKLNKFAEAERVLEELRANAKDPQNKVEADFRIGDVFIAKNDLKAAEKAYLGALERHPEAAARLYPNVHYNLAEAYFWTPRYHAALNRFVDFLERFPDHPFGAYAMTRVGELLQILGADQSKYMGAFLESSYRFKNAPGAEVAQIRMLSQRMKSMKENELKKVLNDLEKMKGESALPRIDEFVTLMIADGFHKRRDYESSMKELINYYQKNPTSADLDFFRKRIVQNIGESLHTLITAGKGFDALKKHQKFASTWLKGNDRIDLSHYLGQAFEQVGVFAEAEAQYFNTLERLLKIKDTKEDFERRVSERLPKIDSLKVSLAKVGFAQKKFLEAQKYLTQIEQIENLSEAEQIQAAQIQAQIYKQKREWAPAIKTLNVLLGRVSEGPRAGELFYDLGQIYAELGQNDQGLEMANKAIERLPTQVKPLELQGDLLVKLGRPLKAAESYLKVVEGDNDKKDDDQLYFKIGDLLFQGGDIAAAEKIWKKIDVSKQPLLKKIAQEKMKSARWESDYKQYIDRIPAMNLPDAQKKGSL